MLIIVLGEGCLEFYIKVNLYWLWSWLYMGWLLWPETPHKAFAQLLFKMLTVTLFVVNLFLFFIHLSNLSGKRNKSKLFSFWLFFGHRWPRSNNLSRNFWCFYTITYFRHTMMDILLLYFEVWKCVKSDWWCGCM